MPIPVVAVPVVLKAAAVAMTLVGGEKIIKGAVKIKNVHDDIEYIKRRHKANEERLKLKNDTTNEVMDKLGMLELEILKRFKEFADIFEKIKNKPIFEKYSKNNITLPPYDIEKLKEAHIGANLLLGSLGGAALGTAAGFAAGGAVQSAVTAFGISSTGAAIGGLKGAALTNAVLAYLGGGSIVAGGGGIAAGTVVLSILGASVGILVGGMVLNEVGNNLKDKANNIRSKMIEAEEKINTICKYLEDLEEISDKYHKTLSKVNEIYKEHMGGLKAIVNIIGKDDWDDFTDKEKKLTENTVLLVELLYNMCNVELIIKADKKDEIGIVNREKAEKTIQDTEKIFADKF